MIRNTSSAKNVRQKKNFQKNINPFQYKKTFYVSVNNIKISNITTQNAHIISFALSISISLEILKNDKMNQ